MTPYDIFDIRQARAKQTLLAVPKREFEKTRVPVELYIGGSSAIHEHDRVQLHRSARRLRLDKKGDYIVYSETRGASFSIIADTKKIVSALENIVEKDLDKKSVIRIVTPLLEQTLLAHKFAVGARDGYPVNQPIAMEIDYSLNETARQTEQLFRVLEDRGISRKDLSIHSKFMYNSKEKNSEDFTVFTEEDFYACQSDLRNKSLPKDELDNLGGKLGVYKVDNGRSSVVPQKLGEKLKKKKN